MNFSLVKSNLKKKVLANVLSGTFNVMDDIDKKSVEYNDPLYLPFYYYLGCEFKGKGLVTLGFEVGMSSSCFLQGCKTIENFFGFQNKEHGTYSLRLGRHNIRKKYKNNAYFYYGDLEDIVSLIQDKVWDIVIIQEYKNMSLLNQFLKCAWNIVAYDGLICVDYLNRNPLVKNNFDIFCTTKNRIPEIFNTRYGNGIIVK